MNAAKASMVGTERGIVEALGGARVSPIDTAHMYLAEVGVIYS